MEWITKMWIKFTQLLGSRRFWQLTLTAVLELIKIPNPEYVQVLTVIQGYLLAITAVGTFDKIAK